MLDGCGLQNEYASHQRGRRCERTNSEDEWTTDRRTREQRLEVPLPPKCQAGFFALTRFEASFGWN